MFGYYSYEEEIAIETRREKARQKRKDVITSDRGWRLDSCGSASCVSSTMDSIFEAYNEYRTCECY